MQEIITNAATGEVTVRDYTPEEIEAALAQRAEAQDFVRSTMSLSFAQLLIGLVAEGWITEEEGDSWLMGSPPVGVLALISTLPQEHRFAAKARAVRPSAVLRSDPLVQALGAAQGKTPEELDVFFTVYSGV